MNATAAAPALPPAPTKSGGPPKSWKHRDLYDRVEAALHALPGRFQSPLVVEGVAATDLHTMNTPLGAAIESSVVDSLNGLRSLWDPKGEYPTHVFVRQSQTFPDVLLRSTDPKAADPIIMGIELKGWFAIAKEGEPSFRYVASANACAPADLLVVVPWVFDSVISGKPRLLQPMVTEARYAALMRNYHWQHVRKSKAPAAKRGVTIAQHVGTYPSKKNAYSDRATADGGANFGRIARVRVFDNEVGATLAQPALGIPLKAWQRFLSIFSENTTAESIERDLAIIEREFVDRVTLTDEQREQVLAHLQAIIDVFGPAAKLKLNRDIASR